MGAEAACGGQGWLFLLLSFLFYSSSLAAEAPVLERVENGNEAGGAVAGKRKTRYSRGRGPVSFRQVGFLKVSESLALHTLLKNSVCSLFKCKKQYFKKYCTFTICKA